MVKAVANRLRKIAEEGVKDLRKLLPAGRGGTGPKLGDRETGVLGDNPFGRQPAQPAPLDKTVRSPESFAKSDKIKQQFASTRRAIRNFELPDLPRISVNMNREEVIRELVNDPMIKITEAMLPIINDPSIMINRNGELMEMNQFANQFRRDKLEPKQKRKPSKYQTELGKQLKMLKKKHPRTKVTALMKRAHRATKKALR